MLAPCHLYQPRGPVATKEQGVGPLKESDLYGEGELTRSSVR
jgi:hypothetical protein